MTSPSTPKRSRLASIALVLAVIAGALVPVDLVLHARSVTGALGLPLDDAWVHLTYARTLSEHGQFSYFPGDPTTAGSTAPLLTLIEAALFRLVRDEKLLGLGLSLLAHAAFLVAFAAWARRRLGSAAWAAAAVLLIAFDHRLSILAASGMETSLFLLCVALAFHARLARRAMLAAIALGVSVWVRPDGLILAAVFALDALLPSGEPASKKRKTADSGRWARGPLLVFAGLVLAYFAFNWGTGHTLVPNTFAAKMAFYRGNTRANFLAEGVLPAFLTVGWIPILPLIGFALGREAWRLFRGRPGQARLEAGWTVALVLAYLLLLPYGHRFQRYLMPAIPAATIAALALLRALLAHPRLAGIVRPLRQPGRSRAGAVLALIAVIALAAFAIPTTAAEYAGIVRHHQARHERTGRWLAENTAPEAVIATHDVGAIGFYSHRRIVDTVGLVTPEIVPAVGTPNYPSLLERLFAKRGVTHVAAFEEWLPVDNVQPLFETDPGGEVMRVYPWRPQRSHIVRGRAWNEAVTASAAISRGDFDLAIQALGRGIGIDNQSAQLWLLLGIALGNADRGEDAERAFRRAVLLYPEWREAREGLIGALMAQDKPITEADLGTTAPADSARR